MRAVKKDRDAAGEYAEAVTEYRQHLDNNPKDAATHLNLAAVLRARGDAAGAAAEFQAAVAQFTDIVQSEPKNLVARRYLGDALEGLQKYDDAAAAYQEALEFKPDAVAVRYRRALSLQMAKKYDAAAAEYREVIKAQPNRRRRSQRAWLCARRDRQTRRRHRRVPRGRRYRSACRVVP